MMGVPLGLGTGWPGRLWQSEGTTEAEPGCGHPCWAGTGGTGLGLGMVSPPGWHRGGWWEAPAASPNHIPVLGGQKPAALGQRHVVPEGCQTLMSPSHMEQTAGSGWGGGRLCTPHPNSHRTVNPWTSTHLRNCATRCSKGGCATPRVWWGCLWGPPPATCLLSSWEGAGISPLFHPLPHRTRSIVLPCLPSRTCSGFDLTHLQPPARLPRAPLPAHQQARWLCVCSLPPLGTTSRERARKEKGPRGCLRTG